MFMIRQRRTRPRRAPAAELVVPSPVPLGPSPPPPPGPSPPPPPAIGTSGASPAADEGRDRVFAVLEALAKVVGPPSLVTALAFFFGWTFTNARFRYFGVDLSTLDLSTADYVLHSVTALFGPMVVLLLLVLLAVGVDGLVSAAVRTRRGARLVRHGARAVVAAGIAITLAGAAQIYWPMPVQLYFLLPPALLGLGATSAYFALWTLQQLRRSGDPSCGDPPSGPTPPPRWLTWGRPPVVLLVFVNTFYLEDTLGDTRSWPADRS